MPLVAESVPGRTEPPQLEAGGQARVLVRPPVFSRGYAIFREGLPVAQQLGYDPIWFGVTITVVTTLGAVTPPVGATTYVVGGMAKGVSLESVFKGVAYFLPAYLICIIILMLFPRIVLFLPGLIR